MKDKTEVYEAVIRHTILYYIIIRSSKSAIRLDPVMFQYCDVLANIEIVNLNKSFEISTSYTLLH